MFGFARDRKHVVYGDIAERMHADDREWVTQQITTAIQQKTLYQAEYRIVLPDGFVRWVLAQGKAIYGDRGNPLSIIGGIMDITDRKQSQLTLQQLNNDLGYRSAERTATLEQTNDRLQQELLERSRIEQILQTNEQRLQFLLSSSPAVLFALDPRDNYRGKYISDNAINVFGYDAEFLQANFNLWLSRVHPDDQAKVSHDLPQGLLENPLYTVEYRFCHADDSERWILAQMRLVRDAAGQPLEGLGYLIDNTEAKHKDLLRQQMETQLQRSEANLREAERVAHMGNWQFDAANQTISWS